MNQSKSTKLPGSSGTSLEELQFLQQFQKSKEMTAPKQPPQFQQATIASQKSTDIQQLINDLNNPSNLKDLYRNPNETTAEKIKSIIKQKINEYILFIIVFTLLSQTFFKDTVCKYIPQIKDTNENGDTTILGILLHGLIILIVFEITKFFLNA
jgi:hypothetical protein